MNSLIFAIFGSPCSSTNAKMNIYSFVLNRQLIASINRWRLDELWQPVCACRVGGSRLHRSAYVFSLLATHVDYGLMLCIRLDIFQHLDLSRFCQLA